jgi:hypothetical protein
VTSIAQIAFTVQRFIAIGNVMDTMFPRVSGTFEQIVVYLFEQDDWRYAGGGRPSRA